MPPRRRPTMDGFDETRIAEGGVQEGGLSHRDRARIQQDIDGGLFDDPIAGSPEGPRIVFGAPAPRQTPGLTPPPIPPQQGPRPGPGPGAGPDAGPGPNFTGQSQPTPDINSIMEMLPQGVEQAGAGSVNAPLASSEPQGSSLRAMPPANAPAGPARQPFKSPVNLVGGGSSPGLVGSDEGLFGGGIGMPGAGSGGPKPTKQMLELLRSMGLD